MKRKLTLLCEDSGVVYRLVCVNWHAILRRLQSCVRRTSWRIRPGNVCDLETESGGVRSRSARLKYARRRQETSGASDPQSASTRPGRQLPASVRQQCWPVVTPCLPSLDIVAQVEQLSGFIKWVRSSGILLSWRLWEVDRCLRIFGYNLSSFFASWLCARGRDLRGSMEKFVIIIWKENEDTVLWTITLVFGVES